MEKLPFAAMAWVQLRHHFFDRCLQMPVQLQLWSLPTVASLFQVALSSDSCLQLTIAVTDRVVISVVSLSQSCGEERGAELTIGKVALSNDSCLQLAIAVAYSCHLQLPRVLPTVGDSNGDNDWRRQLTRGCAVAILLQSCWRPGSRNSLAQLPPVLEKLRPSGRNPTSPLFGGGAFAPPLIPTLWVLHSKVIQDVLSHLHGFG